MKRLIAEGTVLKLYEEGTHYTLIDSSTGKVVEDGEGEAFGDYIDRRWGSCMKKIRLDDPKGEVSD